MFAQFLCLRGIQSLLKLISIYIYFYMVVHIFFSFGSDLLQEVKPLTDAAKSIVEQKMDNMNGVYTEALAQLKALSSQITTMPASELIQKVDQIVG